MASIRRVTAEWRETDVNLSHHIRYSCHLLLISITGAAAQAASTVAATWWKARFQALWLPSLKYADGSLGFVQLDISLDDTK